MDRNQNNGIFDFCRSCGSGHVEIKRIEENGYKLWKCQDCGRSWNEITLSKINEDLKH